MSDTKQPLTSQLCPGCGWDLLDGVSVISQMEIRQEFYPKTGSFDAGELLDGVGETLEVQCTSCGHVLPFVDEHDLVACLGLLGVMR